jgi:hypothetical protein
MSIHAQLTSATAKAITDAINKRRFDVYYDHGDPLNPLVGTIAVSIGKKLDRDNQISQMDIAVIERNSNNALALVEIEETNDSLRH